MSQFGSNSNTPHNSDPDSGLPLARPVPPTPTVARPAADATSAFQAAPRATTSLDTDSQALVVARAATVLPRGLTVAQAVLDLVILTGGFMLATWLIILVVVAGLIPDMGIAMFAQPMILGLVMLSLTHRILLSHGETMRDIGLQPMPILKALKLALLGFVSCGFVAFSVGIIVTVYTAVYGDGLDVMIQERADTARVMSSVPLLLVPILTVFVGYYEEVLFRGVLMNRIKIVTGSNFAAVFLSTLVFALLHLSQGATATISIFGLGLVFALFTIWSKSLWPAIIAHALWDLVLLGFVIRAVDFDALG